MYLKAAIQGDLKAAMQAEVKRVAGAMRRGITTAAQQTQADLRAHARGASFKDGGRAMANAWRMAVYPRARETLKPAALVFSRMPDVVAAFDKGAVVRTKKGKYLAWPTGYNAALGRRNAGRRGGLRVTPEQMVQAGKRNEAFVIPSKANPRVSLWCLRITQEVRGRRGVKVYVGRGVEVATGRVKGLQQKRRELLSKGFIPMFFLARQVTLRKLLDIAAVRALAAGRYARAAASELARLS